MKKEEDHISLTQKYDKEEYLEKNNNKNKSNQKLRKKIKGSNVQSM